MGVIRKKTAARGAEGGVKYVCDVCSADITSTVSDSYLLLVLEHVADRSLGPHKMRSQRLQRIRPLRPLLLKWRNLPQPPTCHPSLPSHRTELRSHIR